MHPARTARRAAHRASRRPRGAEAARMRSRCGAGVTSRVRRSTDSGIRTTYRDGEKRGHDPEDVRPGRADRVRADSHGGPEVAPVGHRVERSVESREEAHVEDLHDGQQAEKQPDQARDDPSRPPGRTSTSADDDEPLDRDAEERGRREPADLVRCHESEPHEQRRQDRGQRLRRRSAVCVSPTGQSASGTTTSAPPTRASRPVRAPGHAAVRIPSKYTAEGDLIVAWSHAAEPQHS